MDESATLTLKLRTATTPQVVRLEMQEIPEGWAATFKGGGQIIQAATVEPDADASVTLKLEPPKDVAAGTYRFVVVARGDKAVARLPIELTIKEKLPPRLSLQTNLPIVQGSRSTTFRFDSTLKNDGDEDLTVNLEADAPEGFLVKFKLSAQEVTSLPLEANQSKTLSIEVRAFADVPAGDYPLQVRARGDGVQATLPLVVRVTGQPDLKVTAPEGRLSGRAYAGRTASLTIIVQNTGSAPAHAVKLSASPPSGWSVEFDPEQVDQIPAGHQAEVTAKIRPADKAVAGDYMVTVTASPEETIAGSKSDFRITVLTSTLWGVVGIVLIALAVGVVALAVLRFGRR
jgi:uncharacterized repeat protein (TIGR01451 family)